MRGVLSLVAIVALSSIGLVAHAQDQRQTESVCQRQCYYGQCTSTCTETSTPIAAPEAPRSTEGSEDIVEYEVQKRKPAGAAQGAILSDQCRPPYRMTERDGCQLRGR